MNPLTRYRGRQDVTCQTVPLMFRHPAGFAVRFLVCVALTATALSVQAEPAPAGATAPTPDTAEVLALRQELARQDALLQKLMSQQADLLSQHKQDAGPAPARGGAPSGRGETASGVADVSPSSPGNVHLAKEHADTLPLNAAAVTPPVVQPPVTGKEAGADSRPALRDSSESAVPVPASAPEAVAPSVPSSGGTVSPGATAPPLQDENARRAYASGVSLAYEMQQSLAVQKSLGISLPQEMLMAGLQDALSNHPLRMPDHDIQSTLASLNEDFTTRMQSRRADEVTRGKEFRSTFRKQKGVVYDAGSLYLIDKKGFGRLRTTDTATLQITGRLPDGTVFDGSGDAGQTRRVKVGAMLPAIAIGLQKVGVGAHLTVVVPPEKGYGDMGLPPTVPGGATLIFDITVKGVNESG